MAFKTKQLKGIEDYNVKMQRFARNFLSLTLPMLYYLNPFKLKEHRATCINIRINLIKINAQLHQDGGSDPLENRHSLAKTFIYF